MAKPEVLYRNAVNSLNDNKFGDAEKLFKEQVNFKLIVSQEFLFEW